MSELDIPSVEAAGAAKSAAGTARDGETPVSLLNNVNLASELSGAVSGAPAGETLPRIGLNRKRTKLEKQQEALRLKQRATESEAPGGCPSEDINRGSAGQPEPPKPEEDAAAAAVLTPFPTGTIGDGEFDFRPFFLNRLVADR